MQRRQTNDPHIRHHRSHRAVCYPRGGAGMVMNPNQRPAWKAKTRRRRVADEDLGMTHFMLWVYPRQMDQIEKIRAETEADIDAGIVSRFGVD